MVRNYNRKTDMALWTLETMQAAVTDIRSNQISLRQAEQTQWRNQSPNETRQQPNAKLLINEF